MALAAPDRIQLGDSGEDVRAVQQALNTILARFVAAGFYEQCRPGDPASPTRPKEPVAENGLFDEATHNLVVWAQCVLLDSSPPGVVTARTLELANASLFGLRPDSKTGELTWNAADSLSPVRFAVTCLGNARRAAVGLPSLPTPEPCPEVPQEPGPTPRLPFGVVLGLAAAAWWMRRQRRTR